MPPVSILTVTALHIETLNERQLPKLLQYLLNSEAYIARKARLEVNCYVPEQINVPDGGSDGDWSGPTIPGFVPRQKALFQCKAEAKALTESKFKDELAPKNARMSQYIVKPKTSEILKNGGAYILLWGHQAINWTPEKIRDTAKKRFEEAQFDLPDESEIIILDSNKIAEWTNRHLSAISYVISMVGRWDSYSLMTCSEFGGQSDFNNRYQDNDYLRKLSDDIISILRASRECIRVTGASGIGKSRFIYETIRNNDEISKVSVFIDYSNSDSGDVIKLVRSLVSSEMETILIIDNCPTSIHKEVKNWAGNSKLSLVTISHEVEIFDQSTRSLVLNPSEMREVVIKILSEDSRLKNDLNNTALIGKIADYSDGFPQMALLVLASNRTLSRNDLVAKTKFFDVLTSAPPHVRNLQIIAQALSLFTILGGKKSTLNQHLETVRRVFFPDVNTCEMDQSILELKTVNMLREEGDTIRIVPPPLATALASLQICTLNRYSPEKLQKIITLFSEVDLLEKFTNRLNELEDSPKLNDIMNVLGIPFQNADYLVSGLESALIFRSLVNLDPEKSMSIVKRSLVGRSTSQLKEDIAPRRNLVCGLAKLAWSRVLFPDAVSLLLRLAAGENEIWGNNATGVLHQLFHVRLSGTSCPALDRLDVLRQHLTFDDDCIKEATIKTFEAVFYMGPFMKERTISISDIRGEKEDWRPSSNDEVLQYWEDAFLILKEFIITNKNPKKIALKILGSSLPSISGTLLVLRPSVDAAFKEICDSLQGDWSEAATSLKHALQGEPSMSEGIRRAQEHWLSYLEEGNWPLSVRITNTVSLPGWHFSDDYVDLSCQNAQELAHSLIVNKTVLDGVILKSLMIGEQQQAGGFGEIYGKQSSKTLEQLFDDSFDQWRTISPDEQKNTLFLSGVMKGMGSAHPFRTTILDRISKDSALKDLLIPLTTSVPIENFMELDRIFNEIIQGAIPVASLAKFDQGLPLKHLPFDDLCVRLMTLLERKPEISRYLIHLLELYFQRNEWRYTPFRELVRKLLIMDENWDSDGKLSVDWKNLTKRELKELSNETDRKLEWISKFFNYIASKLNAGNTSYHTKRIISEVFDSIVDEFSSEILDIITQIINNNDYCLLKKLLSDSRHTAFDDRNRTWLTKIPEHERLEWIRIHPEVINILLECIPLYTISAQDDWVWEPFIIELMKQSQESSDKIANLVYINLASFGSTGSRVPYWEKREQFAERLKAGGEYKLMEIGEILITFIKEKKDYTQREEKNQENWDRY